jgi:competence protein ComEC
VPAALAAWIGAWLGTHGGWALPVALLVALGCSVLLALTASALLLLPFAPRRRRLRRGGWAVRPSLPALVLCVLVAACATVNGYGRVVAVGAGPVPGLARDGATVEVLLRVTGDPVPRVRSPDAAAWLKDQVRVEATLTRVRPQPHVPPWTVSTPVVVLAPDSWSGLRPGDVLAQSVRLVPAERAGPVAALALAGQPPQVVARTADPFAWADAPRRALRAAVAGLPPGPAGLLPSLVVGDESLLDDQVRRDLRATGLTHLTAVSGANVAIVLGAVLFSARWVGLRGTALPVTGVLSIAGFVLLARPEPSVVRAAAMGVVVVLGLVAGARGRGIAPLAVACVVLLLADPWLCRSLGFVLSCLATAGIVLLARPWQARAARWMPRWAAMLLAVPLAAQVACTPVLVAVAQQLSIASLPANLLVAPAVPAATVLGLLAAVVGVASPAVAHLVATVAMVPAGWIVLVSDHGAQMPGASLPWQWGLPVALGLSVGLGVVVPVLLGSRLLSVGACVALLVLLLRPGPTDSWPPPGWVLVACDVGQGDALVLDAGGGQAVVVDAGAGPSLVDRCLDDLQVRAVPALVITHFHADHAAGISGVADGRPVGEVLTTSLADPPEQAAAVTAWASALGVPVRLPQVGERARVGRVEWSVLWPGTVIPTEGSRPNQASVVLLADVGGVSVLLTGDVESAAQLALAEANDLRVDVLKVPHHGSADQHPQLLAEADPAVALVSVGRDNTYGHPDPALLDTLRAQGAVVARTDIDGDVAVVATASEQLTVVRRGPRPP